MCPDDMQVLPAYAPRLALTMWFYTQADAEIPQSVTTLTTSTQQAPVPQTSVTPSLNGHAADTSNLAESIANMSTADYAAMLQHPQLMHRKATTHATNNAQTRQPNSIASMITPGMTGADLMQAFIRGNGVQLPAQHGASASTPSSINNPTSSDAAVMNGGDVSDTRAYVTALPVPESSDTQSRMFVSIVSYCDPEVYPTIADCLARASAPGRVSIGLVLQEDSTNKDACGDSSLITEWQTHIRTLRLDAQEAAGPCWARRLAQSLWRGERLGQAMNKSMYSDRSSFTTSSQIHDGR